METYMQSTKALGTDIEFRIWAKNQQEAEVLFKILWKEVFDFEEKFSRFKKTSEVSLLNSKAGEKIGISNEFLDILNKSKYFNEITDGVFNPFILPELQRRGYKNSMTGSGDLLDYENREIFDFNQIEIGKDFVKIPKNSAIDLGGIGKGYLADKLSQELNKNEVEKYCLSFGGDMVLKGEWEIDIESINSKSNSGKTNLNFLKSDKIKIGIATSSTIRKKNSIEQKHLIGNVISNYELCTVVSAHGVSADVLASCFLMMEEKKVQEFVDKGIVKAVLFQSEDDFKILGDEKCFRVVW